MTAHNLPHHRDRSFIPQKILSLSNQLVVPVIARQLINCLDDFVPPQPYIEKLLPFVRNRSL